MTVDVARRRTRKPKIASKSESLAIGEIDQTVFACPACARPLALGARHCPGCGTHLILGVQAKRASIFAGVGLIAGIVVSGLIGATAAAIGTAMRDADAAAAAAAVANALPSTAATATPSPSPSPSATTGTTSTFPGLTRSALVEAAAIHTRLATSSATLVAAVGSGPFDTLAVSGILRATSGDAVVGLQLTPVIRAWSGGETLSADLRTFYLAVQATAAEGLSASIRNDTAYRAAAEKMIALLGGLEAVDAQLRDVAGRAGVSLAPAP